MPSENDPQAAQSNEPIAVVTTEPVGQEIKSKLESIFARAIEGMPIYEELGGIKGITASLKTDAANGVAPSSLEARRQVFGENALPAEDPVTFWEILAGAWSDHMIIILTIAAIVSLVLGLTIPAPGEDNVDYGKGWIEGVAILISVLTVTTVSSVNDYQKEKKFRKLTEQNAAQPISVIRGGQHAIVDITELVVGDVALINSGLVMPMDAFYIRGQSVVVDESSVTGENDPKKKSDKAPFFLMGTVVNTAENAWVLVGAVGINSFGGKLLMEARGEGGPRPTPLQERLDELADIIGKFGTVIAIILFVTLSIIEAVKFATHSDKADGQNFLSYFIISVAIVVVAVPEGLPLAVTIALAYSQNKMRKDNNQVRRLKACETMGNATCICSDKTGTLTQNLMSVVQGYVAETHFRIDRPGELLEKINIEGLPADIVEFFTRAIAMNSSSVKSIVTKDREGKEVPPKWQWDLDKGNKTDNALLDFVDRVRLAPDDVEKIVSLPHQRLRSSVNDDTISIFPFTSDRKRMTSCVRDANGQWTMFAKGGADQILPLCDSFVGSNGQPKKLGDADKERILGMIKQFAGEANRNIGVAYLHLSTKTKPEEEPVLPMVWMGLVGIQDPLRPEVAEAVHKCQHAGVVVRMCTGDNIDTAIAISRQCGIYSDSDGYIAMTGTQFRNKVYDSFARGEEAKKEFMGELARMRVLARSQPLDKQLLVLLLMTQGEVVAVTGDGTNDAPALRLANVGFVMRSGTDIAVKSADIILLDDNFRSVQRAVVWGRCVNDNIRKFLQLQLSVNVVSVLLTFIGSVSSSNQESPLTTVQLLWINLIMDTFAALALATEEPNEECLNRGPVNRKANVISRRMICTVLCQAAFHLTITLLLMHLGHKWFNVDTMEEEGEIRLKNNHQHNTIVFNTFVWMVVFNEFNARKLYEELNIFEGFGRSKMFFIILAITAGFQVFAVEVAGDFMNTKSQKWDMWIGALGFGLCSWPIGVASRLIPVKEPEVEKEFDEDDLDEEAKKMFERLQEEIKKHAEEKAAELGLSASPRSSRARELWKKVQKREIQPRLIVRAFRRAHIDQDLHSANSKKLFLSMKQLQ